MTPPFKMKGYTYPGKSPIKKDKSPTIKLPRVEVQKTVVDTDDDKPLKTVPFDKGAYDKRSAEYKAEKKVASDKEKADKKTARGEFWRDLAGEAGKALVIAGIQAGATALSRGKSRPSRRGPDVSGFSSIQYGRK